MDLSAHDLRKEWSGSPPGTPELRLVLVGNIGCGKSLTADTLLGQISSGPQILTPSRLCEVRRSVSHGRRLTVVETPRWYWSGQDLESGVHRETERSLGLSAPGPHAFLILVPVGQFTEMERQIPAQLERVFGPGVLDHTLVLLTCGDYLLGRDDDQYLREEPQLKAMVERCGGRWHVINNRQPQDRHQVVSLLEKVEQLAQSHGGCYLQRAVQMEVEARVQEKEREFQRKYSFKKEKTESSHSGTVVSRNGSREESEEKVTSQQLTNGLHSQPSLQQQEMAAGRSQRAPSFKLTKEGAILSQMLEQPDGSISQNNQNFRNTIYHRITSAEDPTSTPLTISPPSSGVATSSSSSSSSNSSSSELRLVLLGQTSSGKSAAGNAILGREEFRLHGNATGAATQQCVRRNAVVRHKQVAVVDTPDWFWSGCSPAELKARLSSCKELWSPGPHAFLLCVPVTRPAHSILRGLGMIEDVFGPEAILRHTLVLFTYSDLLGGEGAEQYVAANHPEMLELVEKCGDRYHVLEPGNRSTSGNVEELLEKVEQLVKERGGSYYSLQQQQEGIERDRTKPSRRERGVERLDEVDRAVSSTLHSLKEEDEDEEEGKKHVEVQESSSRLSSVLRFVGGKLAAGARCVPKLVAGGALVGGAVGLFFGGPLGGAVGATAGSAAAEVGRRKYSKSKTD